MSGITGRKAWVSVCIIALAVYSLYVSSTWVSTQNVDGTAHRLEYGHYRSAILTKDSDNVSSDNFPRGKTYLWAWFSLRWFWRKQTPYLVEFECGDDTIILKHADQDVSKIGRASVVIFAGGFNDIELWKKLKENRDPLQVWVFNTDESALTTGEYLPPLEYIDELKFNITFTYHTKSELSIPYGYYERYPTNHTRESDQEIDYHKLRGGFAAFMSSHCDTIAWSRGNFAKDLSEYIPLDRFGSCGNLTTCPRHSSKCTQVMKQYKFILGLENTCCEEYITEKFWHTLVVLNSIPVVLGANKVDYERIGPPDSFIHAGDFESMEELAAYLRKVAGDPRLYNSYFRWKKEGYVRETDEGLRRARYKKSVCRLGEYIQSGAWKDVEKPLDVYGEHWHGGCKGCSDKKWITDKYGKAPGRYIHN